MVLPLGYGGMNHVAERQENSDGYAFRSQMKKTAGCGISPEQAALRALPERTEAVQSPVVQPSPFTLQSGASPGSVHAVRRGGRVPMENGDRHVPLHRLQCLRDRLPGGK